MSFFYTQEGEKMRPVEKEEDEEEGQTMSICLSLFHTHNDDARMYRERGVTYQEA